MTLGPEDVRAARFREVWRGYDRDEVDDFMSRVGHALQVLTSERDEAIARAEALASGGSAAEDNERLLRRVLLTAERTAEETIQRAEIDVERMRSEARVEAEQLRTDAQERAAREVQNAVEMANGIRKAVQDFRTFRDEHHRRIRDVVHEQLRALEAVGEIPEMPEQMAAFEQIYDPRPTEGGNGSREGHNGSGDDAAP